MSSKDDLQPYVPDLAAYRDFDATSTEIDKILADAHAHYLAQVRQLAGLARPDAEPTNAQLQAGLNALSDCGIPVSAPGGIAVVDSVYRAMQEVAK